VLTVAIKTKLAFLSVISLRLQFKEDPHLFKGMAIARIKETTLGQAKTTLCLWNRTSAHNREFGCDRFLVRT